MPATVLLYYFGPIDWDGSSEPWVALYIFVCVLCFNLGYKSVARPDERRYSDFDVVRVMNKRWFAITVMIVYSSLSLYHMQLTTGQTLSSVIHNGANLNSVYGDYQDFLQNRPDLSGSAQIILLIKALIFPIALVLFCAFSRHPSSSLRYSLFQWSLLALRGARIKKRQTFC